MGVTDDGATVAPQVDSDQPVTFTVEWTALVDDEPELEPPCWRCGVGEPYVVHGFWPSVGEYSVVRCTDCDYEEPI